MASRQKCYYKGHPNRPHILIIVYIEYIIKWTESKPDYINIYMYTFDMRSLIDVCKNIIQVGLEQSVALVILKTE